MSDPRLPSLTPATKKDNPALRILAYIHFGSGSLESWNVSFSVGVASVEALVCSTIVSVCVWVLMMEWNMIIWFLGIITSRGQCSFSKLPRSGNPDRVCETKFNIRTGTAKTWRNAELAVLGPKFTRTRGGRSLH